MLHESFTETTNMAVLLDFTMCSLVLTSLRANFQSAIRIGRSGGPPASAEALQCRAGLSGQARPSNSRSLRFRLRQSFDETGRTVPQAGSHFRGLVTPIHETFGLGNKARREYRHPVPAGQVRPHRPGKTPVRRGFPGDRRAFAYWKRQSPWSNACCLPDLPRNGFAVVPQ
jgi:hypothetical protein